MVVTLSLINKQIVPANNAGADAYCYFQPSIVVAEPAGGAVFLPGTKRPTEMRTWTVS